ncbi:MAG: site-specific DNA-methyltransferase [Dehalobacter sp.]|nr:site-specific DNA-methyltransferase [Dehalobacter sp.]
MNKPKFETSSLITESVAKIAELFPGAVTEGKVNFDLLRSLLGDEVYGNEAYEFTWVGKKAAIAEAGRPIRKTLRPCVEESKDWDTTGNLYIEGDNLDVLKLLQESYLGKVKLIYIDPPYNTGNDFVYRDNFTQDKDEYDEEAGVFDEDGDRLFRNTESNGRFHSDWCSMMYPRLVLARNLLRNEGVIFISIDDNEQASLKKLCDEVFGERYFIGCFVWKRRTSSSMDQSKASTDHEYVIAYHKGGFTALKGTEKDYAGYSNPDNDPRGIWTTGDLTVGMNGDMRPNQYYDLINPATGKVYKANYNRVWSYTPDSMKRLIDENRVIFPEDTSKRPMLKRFASELKSDTNPFSTWMKDIGLNTEGTRIANALFNNTSMFNYAKPISLVKNVIEQVTSDNDIILDFFSGSATTAHAVMQLNAEDGGNRKFIMVQLPELCTPDSEAAKAGYKNICEIGKERIRRAGEKIVAEGISKTTMKKIGGEVLEPVLTDDGMIEHSSTTEYEIKTESKAIYYLDIGFRVLKLDDTNMKDVYYAAGKYTQDLLAGMEDNIKDDRTDMDLLYACLLDWGLPLSMPHTHEKIDGFTVHTYNEGDLIACFDKQISDAVVKEIAKRQPLRAVFRDSSFNSSPEKINVEEIFKLLAPNTNVRVI